MSADPLHLVKRRKRVMPNNKYTKEETIRILDFMQEHKQIEKPTAKLYYKKLMVTKKLNTRWDLLKYRVSYLKRKYRKANQLIMTNGNSLDEESLREHVLFICPFYDRLSAIFGNISNEIVPVEKVTPAVFNGTTNSDSEADADTTMDTTESASFANSIDSKSSIEQRSIEPFKIKVEPPIEHAFQSDLTPLVEMPTAEKSENQNNETHCKDLTDTDNIKMLDYILAEGNFLKPTAKIYLNKLILATKINSSWYLLKQRLCYLKRCFSKAEDFRKQIESRISNDRVQIFEQDVTSEILKICPHYQRLIGIFGVNGCAATFVVRSNNSSCAYNLNTEFDDIYEGQLAISEAPAAVTPSTTPDITHLEVLPNDNVHETAPTANSPSATQTDNSITLLAQLIALQNERREFFKSKIDLQRQQMATQLEIDKRKLALQENQLQLEELKFKAEIDLKKQEFELKKLQIEKEERVAMYEIEMKYRKHS